MKMGYCENCKITILDDTEFCPLCHNGLKKREDVMNSTGYPDILLKKKKAAIFFNIMLFITVVTFIINFFLNSILKIDMNWLYIFSASLLYVALGLRQAVIEAGYIKTIFYYMIGAVLLVVFIDFVTGSHRWSVNFVLPGTMLLMDFVFIILMIVNNRNWQGYMLYQIFMIVLGLIPIGLIEGGVVTHPLVSEIAFLSAVIVFLGTLIIGGHNAREELKRRFHI
jgi:hypothetical protein